MKRHFNQLKREISTNKSIYIFVGIILFLAFFVRIYRVDQILGFYYDQGRDALVIWDLWHNGKFFLIGPTTGIEGIFRGPWYYWLIAPFYLMGSGNPVWPSVFLAFTTVVAVALIYVLGVMVLGRGTGLLAAFIASFSFHFVYGARWLSNPTPMFLVSMLLVLGIFLVLEGKKWAWILIGLVLGMSMQFGSAAELFYFPAVLVFAIWLASRSGQRKNLPDIKIFLVTVAMLFVTFLPQIIFDLRHDGILRQAIAKFLFEQESFKASFWEVVKIRIPFYFDVFSNKLFLSHRNYDFILGTILLFIIFTRRRIIFGNHKFLALGTLFVSPLIGMLFFQGNYGNVYDHYFTGYYLIFVLIFSYLLGLAAKDAWGKTLIIVFVFVFLQINLPSVKSYLESDIHKPLSIFLGNQKEAVDWVYKNAVGHEFNVDVYVPPVISYSYDYLFLSRGEAIHRKLPNENEQSLLYTLYEQDTPHPERLESWLARQRGIGEVQETMKFGGITVERRIRMSNEAMKQ